VSLALLLAGDPPVQSNEQARVIKTPTKTSQFVIVIPKMASFAKVFKFEQLA